MRLSVVSFTEKGNRVNQVLTKRFREMGETCTGYVMNRFADNCHGQEGMAPLGTSLREWAKEQFQCADGLIFVGATGIAVRTIAPFVRDKMTDPAVVTVDEKLEYSISLLSGHVGGANELARTVARMTGAAPVITTATDVNGRFAVDVFARERKLVISDRSTAKRISADVLEGRPVGFCSDFPVEGEIPEGLVRGELCVRNVWITGRVLTEGDSWMGKPPAGGTEVLRLIPKVLAVGIGCRRGALAEDIEKAVEEALRKANRSREAIKVIVSIDLKKEEPGLLTYAADMGLEFHTYPSTQLKEVPGDYTDSVFVAEVTGVGNVCERAAMLEIFHAGGGRLILGKQTWNGVTVALAERDWKVRM